MEHDTTFTVAEFGALVRGALEQVFPYGVWVAGTISDIKRPRNGHVYFDLVDAADEPGAAPTATVPVVLFRESRQRINSLLKRHGDPIRMDDGVQIRVQGMVDYYPPQGRLQLRMTAIDPTYTVGLLAAERDALLRRLREERLIERNARVPMAPVPLRVAVVTSLGSAAHADITTVFASSGLSLCVYEIDAAVQGAGAESAIAAAIETAGRIDVDTILLARGGGSRTDLAVFDHEIIARAIAHAPVPVITGIGHDIDRSVADEVAHTAATTPTAAARHVVDLTHGWLTALAETEAVVTERAHHLLASADSRARRLDRAVARAGSRALGQSRSRVDGHAHRLVQLGTSGLRSTERGLDRMAEDMGRRAERSLTTSARTVDSVAARVRALDPARALARGWSISTTEDGAVVRSVDQLDPGDRLVTRLADGTLTSTIDAADPAPADEDPR